MSSQQFELHLPTVARRPSSLRPLSLMKFVTKRQHPKPVANSNPWAVRRKRVKRPKFEDMDLKRIAEFDDMLSLNHYNPGRGMTYRSAYVEVEDDSSSVTSFSTNATMDGNPGAGLTIDKYFYQPVGRAIEKFALKIVGRLNIYHPSPAQILRFLKLYSPGVVIYQHVKKPSDVIARISAERPSAVPGILSLVQQSQ